MAKSKAQTLTLWQEMTRLKNDIKTFLSGTFTTTYNLVSAAIAAGDDLPEDEDQKAALEAVRNEAVSLYDASLSLLRTVHPTLGRYAAAADYNDPDIAIAAFHDKLTTDSEAVESRGLTKFTTATVSAGGSNQGDAKVVVLNTNPQGVSMDISHVDTLTFRCVKDASDGSTNPGNEEFEVKGTAIADFSYLSGGSGVGNAYEQPYGDAINDFSGSVLSVNTGESLKVVGGDSDNLLSNGDFEDEEGTGTTKINGFDITSGDTNLSILDTGSDIIKDLQSLNAVDNFTMDQDLQDGQVKTLQAYCIHALIRVDALVTAGTVTFKVKDDSATHGTLSIDTTTLVDDTDTSLTPVAFFLPVTADLDTLRFEIELTGYAGSGDIIIDEVKLGAMRFVDGGRAVAIVRGLLDSIKNDIYTGATSSTEAGTLQLGLVEAYGAEGNRGWVRHAGAAVFWTDP